MKLSDVTMNDVNRVVVLCCVDTRPSSTLVIHRISFFLWVGSLDLG